MFSETIKNLRLQKNLTLRDFCQKIGLDASNWSKVERGINPPPNDSQLLEKLAAFFNLAKQEKIALLDEAAAQRKELPADIADSDILQKALPAFFRAARNHELTEEELKQFAKDIRKHHTRDSKSSKS